MKSLVLSIIIPIYNAGRYLERCVESALHQLQEGIEIILVDDGSTDSSPEICERYSRRYENVKTYSKKNGGVSSARNYGLEMASGEFVMFLDSDDRLAPSACKTLIGEMNAGGYDCVICGIKQDNGTIWAPADRKEYRDKISFQTDFLDNLNSELLSICFNKIYRRSLIKNNFNEALGFGEDLVFCLDYLVQCENVLFILDTLYLHNNINEDSLTHNVSRNRLVDIELAQKRVLQFSEDRSPRIYRKYVRDVSNWLMRVYSCRNLTPKDKATIISKWYRESYIRTLSADSRMLGRRAWIVLRMTRLRLCWPLIIVFELKRIWN